MQRRTTFLVIAAAASLLGAVALAQEVPANTSIGDTHDGRIAGGGAELPRTGPGFHFASNRDNPEARYGTPSLIGALTRAAAEVAAAHPGSDLEIDDIALRGGGPIQGHGSHRSGRDADVAYYARNADGTPMNPTRSIWFARSGRERGVRRDVAARFDAERTWLFLRALLRDGTIEVRYVFMAPHLQRRVREAAGDAPEAAALRRVLRRPRGRRVDPHADHLHVRIACPPDDVAFGCRE